MKNHLLVTGFGPFPGIRINPSAELARAVAKHPCWARLGWRWRHAVLPVGYGPMQEALGPLLEKRPQAVLMLGIAARRRFIGIEMLARNRASRTQRDQSGRLPRSRALDSGPAILRGRAPMNVLREIGRAHRLPVRLSRDAGPYLCNAAYRFALRRTEARVPVVFVHIPRVRRMGDRRGLAFEPLQQAVRAMARRLALAARLNR